MKEAGSGISLVYCDHRYLCKLPCSKCCKAVVRISRVTGKGGKAQECAIGLQLAQNKPLVTKPTTQSHSIYWRQLFICNRIRRIQVIHIPLASIAPTLSCHLNLWHSDLNTNKPLSTHESVSSRKNLLLYCSRQNPCNQTSVIRFSVIHKFFWIFSEILLIEIPSERLDNRVNFWFAVMNRDASDRSS